jgi:hypothetical protein
MDTFVCLIPASIFLRKHYDRVGGASSGERLATARRAFPFLPGLGKPVRNATMCPAAISAVVIDKKWQKVAALSGDASGVGATGGAARHWG